MNGYKCFYKNKEWDIYANTSYEAQKKCALENNIKKSYEISVHLCEKEGEQVEHIPTN